MKDYTRNIVAVRLNGSLYEHMFKGTIKYDFPEDCRLVNVIEYRPEFVHNFMQEMDFVFESKKFPEVKEGCIAPTGYFLAEKKDDGTIVMKITLDGKEMT